MTTKQDQRIKDRIAIHQYMTKVDGMDSAEAYEIVRSYTFSELTSMAKYYRRQPEYQATLKPEFRT